MSSKKLGKACLKAMMHRVVQSGERARGVHELLKLERFDEAMDVAYGIEPPLYEANHFMQSVSLFRHADRESKKSKKAKPA